MSSSNRLSTVIAEQFERQTDFLQQLVRTKSSNPFTPDTSSPYVPIELEVAHLIAKELEQLGFQASLHGMTSQRPNVVSHIRSSNTSGKTLILTTHMDTVEPSRDTRSPWDAHIKNGRLYGVGAADAKAQIAIFIYALSALHHLDIALPGTVTLAFVVDEETGACSPYGTNYLLEQGILHGDSTIIGEPGNEKIAIGHRGLYRFRIQTQGEAIHTGMKAWEQKIKGHNAILDMARIILALSNCTLPEGQSKVFADRKSLLTFPTLIQGGTGINIVPDFCEAYGDTRLLPGISAHEIRHVIEGQLAHIPHRSYRLEDIISVPAIETDVQSEIVQALKQAIEGVTGISPRIGGSGPACDGWMFATRGIPTVCGYGVASGGVHGTDEWVDIESMRTVTEIYTQAIMRYFSVSLAE